MFHEGAHEQLTFDKCRLCETCFWIKSSLKKTHLFVQCVDYSQGPSLCVQFHHDLNISEKMKTLILATTLFSNWPKNSRILSDIFISISKFLFGTPKLIYQINALGVVGGVLGRISMLKFHHNYADFPAQIFHQT